MLLFILLIMLNLFVVVIGHVLGTTNHQVWTFNLDDQILGLTNIYLSNDKQPCGIRRLMSS